ncbi:hypothetical protein V6N13_148100 [Hibiscus sabdariffa]
MTALWFWWCLAYMAVYVSVARLLKGPLTRPYPCPWSIGLFSLSGNDIPYGFGKTRSLPVLFRCLRLRFDMCRPSMGCVLAALFPSKGPHWPLVGCCVESHPHPVILRSKMPMPSPYVKGSVPYEPSC